MGYMNVRDYVEGKHGLRPGYPWKVEAAEPGGGVGEKVWQDEFSLISQTNGRLWQTMLGRGCRR
jgi:hypothetical protein